MGLFSRLFKSADPIEAELERDLILSLQLWGAPQPEATKMAREVILYAKKEVAKLGLENQRPNLGDWLLEQESQDAKLRASLEGVRAEGVRDEDIRYWWNKSELERMVLEKVDDMHRVSLFLSYLEKGMMDEKQAAKQVFQYHPKYGRPNDGEGEDGALPIELRRRIVDFIERNQKLSREIFKKRLEQCTSFNALVRQEIRNGRL